MGRYKEAIEEYNKYLSIKPNDEEVIYYITEAYNYVGDYEEAEKITSQLIDINKHNYAGYYAKAVALINQRKLEEALRYLEESKKRSIENISVYMAEAYVYELEGKEKKAIDLYYEILGIDGEVGIAFFRLGKMLYRQKRYKEAIYI